MSSGPDSVLRIVSCGDPAAARLLAQHPRAVLQAPLHDEPGISFLQGTWARRVAQGPCGDEASGLAELADNNPWVCADAVTLPQPSATLALIALGPLVRAGMLVESPTILSNAPDDGEAAQALAAAGWPHGVDWVHQDFEDADVVAATAMAVIATPRDPQDLDALFDEAYGRSFYVRRDENSKWDLGLVRDCAHAVYRLRYTADEPHALLTVQLMAARDGKIGAAQLVHAMNIMAGFEESLGLGAPSTR